jgi:hypothetical protein
LKLFNKKLFLFARLFAGWNRKFRIRKGEGNWGPREPPFLGLGPLFPPFPNSGDNLTLMKTSTAAQEIPRPAAEIFSADDFSTHITITI